jgi:ATP-dependent Clp protease adaptor protein ClpS
MPSPQIKNLRHNEELRNKDVPMNIVSVNIASVRSATIEAPEKAAQIVRKPYPNFKIVVLNDDFNTFEHVASCLVKCIPHMDPEKAWGLTNQVHFDGSAIVWTGPQEQAELYHTQLGWEGLTLAPLEAA